MQVAEMLSDLATLQACVCTSPLTRAIADLESQDYEAALALVTSHRRLPDNTQPSESTRVSSNEPAQATSKSKGSRDSARAVVEDGGRKPDADLQRAFDLMDLHYNVKEKWVQGEDMGLQQARRAVEDVVAGMSAGDSQRRRG